MIAGYTKLYGHREKAFRLFFGMVLHSRSYKLPDHKIY